MFWHLIGLKWTEIGILSNFRDQNFVYFENEAHFEMFIIIRIISNHFLILCLLRLCPSKIKPKFDKNIKLKVIL